MSLLDECVLLSLLRECNFVMIDNIRRTCRRAEELINSSQSLHVISSSKLNYDSDKVNDNSDKLNRIQQDRLDINSSNLDNDSSKLGCYSSNIDLSISECKTFRDMFHTYDKAGSIIQGIYNDDPDTVMIALSKKLKSRPVITQEELDNRYKEESDEESNNTSPKEKKDYYAMLPDMLIPSILIFCTELRSIKVFGIIVEEMIWDINTITRICEDHCEYIQSYLEDVFLYILESCNAEIYQAFFFTLSRCDWGVEPLLWEGISGTVDHPEHAFYYAYVHKILTGDNKPYEVLKKYISAEFKTDKETMIEIALYVNNLDFVMILLKEGHNKKKMHKAFTKNGCRDIIRFFLCDQLSYEDAKSSFENDRVRAIECSRTKIRSVLGKDY